jgi:hypothetical protein
MLIVIHNALIIANFENDYPALLEINPKMLSWGGRGNLILSKKWPLFVCCLSVFLGDLRAMTCLKKLLVGSLCTGPPNKFYLQVICAFKSVRTDEVDT